MEFLKKRKFFFTHKFYSESSSSASESVRPVVTLNIEKKIMNYSHKIRNELSNLNIFSKIQNLQLFQSEMNYSHDIFGVNLQKIATIVTLIFDFLKNGSKMTFLENRF